MAKRKDYFERGYKKAMKGNFRDAVKDFSREIKRNPKCYGAYCNRGNARYELGDWAGAIRDYTKAIKLFPHKYEAYLNRGNLLMNLEGIEQAFDDFNTAILLNKKSAEAYNSRGLLKLCTEDYSGSYEDLNRAIRLFRGRAKFIAYLNRGLLREELGNTEGALSDYDTVITLNPKCVDAYYYRGVLLIEKFYVKDRAKKDLERAIELGKVEAVFKMNRYFSDICKYRFVLN